MPSHAKPTHAAQKPLGHHASPKRHVSYRGALIALPVVALLLAAGLFAARFVLGTPSGKKADTQQAPASETSAAAATHGVILMGSVIPGPVSRVTADISDGTSATVQSVAVKANQSVRQDEVLLTLVVTEEEPSVRTDGERAALDWALEQQRIAADNLDKAKQARDDAWKEYRIAEDKAEVAHQEWEQDMADYEAAVAASQKEVDRIFEETGEVVAVPIEVPWPGDEPPLPKGKPSDELDKKIEAAQEAYDSCTAKVEEAQAAYDAKASEQQEAQTTTREVKAPVTGAVIDLKATKGLEVTADDRGPLVTIADTSQMRVIVKKEGVTENQLKQIERGMTATVTFSALDQLTLTATVSRANAEDGVVLRLDDGDERLRPGMEARIEFAQEAD